MEKSKIRLELPEGAGRVIGTLRGRGFEAYAVGGCVRDSLLGKTPHDWDICTDAMPRQVEECFRELRVIETGIKHGTVTVLIEGEPYEITTFRTDGAYTDHRRPDGVRFISDLTGDLARRDFTVNAMAYADETGIVDPFHGQEDLKTGIIRCVGDPDERFREDALRILRAVRFASAYGFAVEEETAAAARRQMELLRYVAPERVRSELCRMLMGKGIFHIMMEYSDLLTFIIPEMEPCVGFRQNNPYHAYDVYEHIARAVENYRGDDLNVRLALLLHDIAKPACYVEKDGVGHFPAHGKESAAIAGEVMRNLRFDNDTRHSVKELVLFHDAQIKPAMGTVRKWLNRIGEEQLRRLLEVREADIRAHSPLLREEHSKENTEVREVLEQVLAERQCFRMKDLAVSGRDLLALGIPEGKMIGTILQTLLDEVIAGKLENERDALIGRAEEIVAQNG